MNGQNGNGAVGRFIHSVHGMIAIAVVLLTAGFVLGERVTLINSDMSKNVAVLAQSLAIIESRTADHIERGAHEGAQATINAMERRLAINETHIIAVRTSLQEIKDEMEALDDKMEIVLLKIKPPSPSGNNR